MASPKRSRAVEPPWLIHFFRRSDGGIPTRSFLDTAPVKIAAEIHAVLEAVATAPPPAFSGGGNGRRCMGTCGGLVKASGTAADPRD